MFVNPNRDSLRVNVTGVRNERRWTCHSLLDVTHCFVNRSSDLITYLTVLAQCIPIKVDHCCRSLTCTYVLTRYTRRQIPVGHFSSRYNVFRTKYFRMRAHMLSRDLLRDGRTPPCSDETPHMIAKANELHARDELKKLKGQGVIDCHEEEAIPTQKLPDCIAIATSKTCTFPNLSTLIIAADSSIEKMYATINRLGSRAHGKRVGNVYFQGQLFSVKYNLTDGVLEVPAARGSGPGAFVISDSQMKNINAHNINWSYKSKWIGDNSEIKLKENEISEFAWFTKEEAIFRSVSGFDAAALKHL